jgi:short-subunit dehydrogenase
MFLVAQPDAVARACLAAGRAGREVVYVPWFWRWIMLVIRAIPERIFKRLNL